MKKTTKILLIILIVLVILLIAVTIYFWPQVKDFSNQLMNKNKNNNFNVNNNTNINVNQTANLNISKEIGDIKIDKSITYKDIVFNLTTAEKTTEFHSTKAGSDKELVVLFIDKITQSSPAEVFTWIQQDVKLTSSQNNDYSINQLKITGKSAADYDTGYFVFETSNTENGFKLKFGQGDKQQIVDLGF